MSSSSNLHSPRIVVKTHPPRPSRPLPSHLRHELRDQLLSRQHECEAEYPDGCCNHDGDLYSRLDHSVSSTLQRNPRAATEHARHDSWDTPTSNTHHLHTGHAHHHHQQHSLDQLTPDMTTSPPNASTTPYHSRGIPFHSNETPFHSVAPPPAHSTLDRGREGETTPLVTVLRRLEQVDAEVKRWIIKADQYMKWEDFEKAIPFLEGAVMRSEPYPRLQHILWELLGNAQMAMGMCKKASVCYLRHLAHSRALGDVRGATRAECNLGISYMRLGLLKLAGRSFMQYLNNSRRLGDERGVESACSNLGLLSKAVGIKRYRTTMEQAGEGETEGEEERRAMENLASCLRRAIIFFKQHLEVVLIHGEIEKQGRAYGNIGSCYELLKDYPEAIFYHQKRLEVARMTGDMYSELCTLCNLGNCLRAKGSLNQALEYYQMDLEMAQSLGDNKMEELLQHNLGVTFELLNQLDNAISCYTIYLGMVVQTGDLKKQAKGFSTLARLYLETGQTTKAHEYYLNLVSIFEKLGDGSSLSSAQLQLRAIRRLMKQERKRRGSHTPSRQQKAGWKGRPRAHTISRASNLRGEIGANFPGTRPQALRNKVGTWSAGRRPRPQLHSDPQQSARAAAVGSDDVFSPDPILAMADLPPAWGQGHTGLSYSTFSYPPQSVTSMPHGMSRGMSCGMSHDMLRGMSHERVHLRHDSQGDSLDSVSCGSGDYDHLSPSPTPQDHTPYPTQNHTYLSYDYDRGRGYELVGPPDHAQYSTNSDLSTTGRSTALPSFSDHTPSTPSTTTATPPFSNRTPSSTTRGLLPPSVHTPFSTPGSIGRSTALPPFSDHTPCSTPSTLGGQYPASEEGEGEMEALQRAGLELARAGLQLAGYEGLGELGMEEDEEEEDKEWQQWREIKENEQGCGFGSLASVAGSGLARGNAHRRRHKSMLAKERLRGTASAPNF